MFYYLQGNVSFLDNNLAVIDCSGVGFACITSTNTISSLKLGSKTKLYTYLNVREDALELFGFSTMEELDMFKLLISISGVGPKAAVSILSSSTPSNLIVSITMGDERALTSAPGIGKKIAQRIILELKDKLLNSNYGELDIHPDSSSTSPNLLRDVHSALSVLGYSSNEINNALHGIDMKASKLEDIIRQALKNLSK